MLLDCAEALRACGQLDAAGEIDAREIKSAIEDLSGMGSRVTGYPGYERAAAIVKEAWESGRTIREVALERRVASPEDIDRALDPRAQTEPGR